MAEKIVDNILENLGENIAENVSKQKSVSSFFEGQTSSSVNSNFKRLFGRQKPVHHLLGGGKCRIIFICNLVITFVPAPINVFT